MTGVVSMTSMDGEPEGITGKLSSVLFVKLDSVSVYSNLSCDNRR